MSIRTCLNELFTHNKMAEKAKRITATVLVAGTILTGAGLTACEQKLNMSNEELASGIVEILQNQNEDLELSNIIFDSMDDEYLMIVGNSDWSEYLAYEISKSQFNKLLKLAIEKNSDYIQVSPNGDSFVITKGGINDENLKEFNEVIYSTISKGNTIDVQLDIIDPNQQGPKPSDDLDNASDREYIEFGLKTNIETNDKDHKFDGFKADYVYVYPRKELKKQDANSTISCGIQDYFEFVDVCSKNGEENNIKKVATFVAIKDFKMDEFISLLDSKVDNNKIRRVEDGYLVNTNIFDDENMSDVNAYFKRIAMDNGLFILEFSYEAPLQEGEFTQEE
ncbi:MAG: hypothetical protein ACI3X1_03110 [Eubacteriales bacterium]